MQRRMTILKWKFFRASNYRVTHQVSDCFVDFDLGVPPCCLHDMPIWPHFQLPKPTQAEI